MKNAIFLVTKFAVIIPSTYYGMVGCFYLLTESNYVTPFIGFAGLFVVAILAFECSKITIKEFIVNNK